MLAICLIPHDQALKKIEFIGTLGMAEINRLEFQAFPIKKICDVEFAPVVKGDNYDFRISDKILSMTQGHTMETKTISDHEEIINLVKLSCFFSSDKWMIGKPKKTSSKHRPANIFRLCLRLKAQIWLSLNIFRMSLRAR